LESREEPDTSAVLYVRNNGEPLIVHNYWAERPFPRGLLACREVSAQADGTFREKDFADRPISRKTLGHKLASLLLRLLRR
jgi:hypothetical protein